MTKGHSRRVLGHNTVMRDVTILDKADFSLIQHKL